MKLTIGGICTILLLSWGLLTAQEVKYVDLSSVSQRIDLRYPPAPSSNCDGSDHCVGGGYGGVSIADGAPDTRDPQALGIYLLNVPASEIDGTKSFELELKVLNTGLSAIELPVSPHLSDLQPTDASQPFTYQSLALTVRVEGQPASCVPCMGYVQLYGISDREGTTVVLRPGEWIRVKAPIEVQPRAVGEAELKGEFWLRTNTFTPHAGGGFTSGVNLYPNVTRTPTVVSRFKDSSAD